MRLQLFTAQISFQLEWGEKKAICEMGSQVQCGSGACDADRLVRVGPGPDELTAAMDGGPTVRSQYWGLVPPRRYSERGSLLLCFVIDASGLEHSQQRCDLNLSSYRSTSPTGESDMPSNINLYQIGVWFCVGFFTGAGWAIAAWLVGRVLGRLV